MSMFVSRSLDYALRSLICLAQTPEAQSMNLRQLAESATVPRSYLAKLMRTLVQAELLRSDAGARGGYRLARAPEAISLKDIYEAVEGTFRTVVCDDQAGACELHDDCTQVAIWGAIEHEILDVLNKRRLADFLPPGGGTAFVPLNQLQVEDQNVNW